MPRQKGEAMAKKPKPSPAPQPFGGKPPGQQTRVSNDSGAYTAVCASEPLYSFQLREPMPQIAWQDFDKIEFRVGTIIEAKDFPGARKPAYQLAIDLGPDVGIKKSSVQITRLYKKDELIGRQVLCVCNFPPKRIANFQSEVLTCGFYLPTGAVVLAIPQQPVPNGSRLA